MTQFWEVKLPCYHVAPYQRNPNFRGREDILSRMRQAIDPNKCPRHQSKLALIGIPGMGKTQIALEYAFESIDAGRYEIVLVAQAETKAKLVNSFVQFDDELGLKGYATKTTANSQTASRDRVKRYLEHTGGQNVLRTVAAEATQSRASGLTCKTDKPWLMIFDNVESPEQAPGQPSNHGNDWSLAEFWPLGNKGSVLVTARKDTALGAPFQVSGGAIENVSGLRVNDSVEILFGISKIQESRQNRQYAEQICVRVAGHPFSLTTVASMISVKRIDFKEYIDLFPNTRLFKEAKPIMAPHSFYENSLTTSFRDAVVCIKHSEGHEDAWKLLELLSFLDPDGVSEKDLSEGSLGSPDHVLRQIVDSRRFEVNRSFLCENNAIDRNPGIKTILMHRMMQDYCHYIMTPDSKQAAFEAAFTLINNLWPLSERHNRHQPRLWPDQERLSSHVVRLAELWSTSCKNQEGTYLHATVHFAELLHNCAWFVAPMARPATTDDVLIGCDRYFYERGNFSSAVPLLSIAELYCDRNPNSCKVVLADIYGVYGGRASECNEAQACYDAFRKQYELIREAIKLGLLRSPDIREALSEGGIGVGKMSLKKYAEAEVAFRRCLKIWEACPGDPSIYVPHLGICLMLQGKLQEADTLLSELIAKRAEKHGVRDRTSFR